VVESLDHQHLGEALENLPPRERRVLELRYGLFGHEQRSVTDIARLLELTRDRVRQIEAKALLRLGALPESDRLRTPERSG